MTSAKSLDSVLPLRWAGGKRAAVPFLREIAEIVKPVRVIDPFLGGGSFLLGVDAPSKHGADSNPELVNFFVACRDSVEEIVDEVWRFVETRDEYERIREQSPTEAIARASRFLYLNRVGYMGLYRTSRDGKFNVPYGGGGRLNKDRLVGQLRGLHSALVGVELAAVDFRRTVSLARAGDLVLLDPPYGHRGDAPFRRYGRAVFSLADHVALRDMAERAREVGATVVVTLPDDLSLTGLYDGWHPCARRSTKRDREVMLISTARVSPKESSGSSGWALTFP